MSSQKQIALYCIGNKLMLDDGIGPAVYEQLQSYTFPNNIDVFDLGCLTLDRISDVKNYDVIITVDAVEGTGQEPGTLFRYTPHDIAQRPFGTQSLHDLSLADLFVNASLLGYQCEGICLGMQVENASPPQVTIGLTPAVYAKLADLVDCVLAELVKLGCEITYIKSGQQVAPGYHHCMSEEE